MDLNYLSTVMELIAAVGDAPGRSPRYYATVGKCPNASKLAKLRELADRGILISEPALHCGRPVTHLSLSPAGQSIYAILVALRALPDPPSEDP